MGHATWQRRSIGDNLQQVATEPQQSRNRAYDTHLQIEQIWFSNIAMQISSDELVCHMTATVDRRQIATEPTTRITKSRGKASVAASLWRLIGDFFFCQWVMSKSCHICERVMAHVCIHVCAESRTHVWRSHGAYMKESWRICKGVMAHRCIYVCEGVMAHIWGSGASMKESWHICECVMAHVCMMYVPQCCCDCWSVYIMIKKYFFINEACCTRQWVTAHVRRSPGTHMQHNYTRRSGTHIRDEVTAHLWKSVMAHMWRSHGTYLQHLYVKKLWCTYAGVMAHLWRSRSTYTGESWHIYICIYIKESCHSWRKY